MKLKHLILGVVVGLMAAVGVARDAFAIGIGRPAPDFSVTDVNGRTQSIRQYRGQTIVIDWIDPECSFNLKHYNSGNIPAIQREARANGVVWLSINSAAPGGMGDFSGERLTTWLSSVNWTANGYIRDQRGVIGRSYRATATPGMYIIDGQGILRYAGAIDSIPSNDPADIPRATNYVRQALAEMRAGRPVSVPATRQYGCTIKYAE